MTQLKKKKKKEYWGKDQEDAVEKYLSLEEGSREGDYIFEKYLYDPLKKLIENIMFTYHLSIPEIPVEDQVFDTMSFVVSKMRKFDTKRGPKSFSYYGTITKNYLIMKKNKHYKEKINILDVESIIGFESDHGLSIENLFESDIESHEYMFTIIANELDKILKTNIKLDKNVYKVGEIVVYLLRNYQYINIHNKRQFYFIAREFTG